MDVLLAVTFLFIQMPGEKRIFTSHMTSGPSLVLCVQRCNAVRKLLQLAGPLNPGCGRGTGEYCRYNFLRGELGIDEFSNAVHGECSLYFMFHICDTA